MSAGLDPKTAPTFSDGGEGDAGGIRNCGRMCGMLQMWIQAKRARVVGEMPDWQQLREAGRQIRQHTMEHLDFIWRSLRRSARGRVVWCIGLAMQRSAADYCAAGEGLGGRMRSSSQVDDDGGDSVELRVGGWRGFIRLRRIWRS